MSEYLIKGDTLTGIADAIRSKTGTSDSIVVSDMATLIESIEGGGGSFSIVSGITETASISSEHTVSGLGFRPKLIVTIPIDTTTALTASYFYCTALLWMDDENHTYDIMVIRRGTEANATPIIVTASENGLTVTATGFVIDFYAHKYSNAYIMGTRKLQYIAATW